MGYINYSMKNLLLGIVTSTVIWGCSPDPVNSLRIRNNYPTTIYNTKINSISYGEVGTGTTTGYKPINEGGFTITGTTTTHGDISGSGSLYGKGEHKWTLTINMNGTGTCTEDK